MLDVSAELRRGDAFDIAVRTGLGQQRATVLEFVEWLPLTDRRPLHDLMSTQIGL